MKGKQAQRQSQLLGLRSRKRGPAQKMPTAASQSLAPCPSPASEWVPVNARPVMVTQQTIRNLAVGDKFSVRVAAISSAGAGPPAVLNQPVHIREIIGKAFLLLPHRLRDGGRN